jgi:ribosomal protein S27AE
LFGIEDGWILLAETKHLEEKQRNACVKCGSEKIFVNRKDNRSTCEDCGYEWKKDT